MSRAWRGGSTRAWRRTRARVLDRDGHRCQLQLDGCDGTANEVHHTHGRAVTGDDPRYLVAACSACNKQIGEPGRNDPAPRPSTRW